MRLPLLFSLVVACASWLAAGAHATPSKLAPVRGVISDAVTGKPIAGGMVGVYQSGLGTAKTDSRGRFSLLAKPGKRIIYYDGGHPYYRSINGVTYTTANVTSKGVSGVRLELFRVQFARGKVFAPSGMPLAGANVTVCGSEFVHGITDRYGKFRIPLPDDQANPGG